MWDVALSVEELLMKGVHWGGEAHNWNVLNVINPVKIRFL